MSTTAGPPDRPPFISGYTSRSILYENETLSLSCWQHGGNPLSTLTWTGICGVIPTTDGSTVAKSMSTITITVTKSYAQETCGCMSTHPQPQAQDRTHVTFTVHYPPDVHVVVPTDVEEGDKNIRLVCQTVGEPNTLISQSWTQTIGLTFITDHFSYETKTPDTIVLSEVYLDDTGTYTCSVSNGVADRQGQTLQSSSSVLNIRVAPKFNSSGQNHHFYSRLHETLIIKIPFYSNPPVTSTTDLEWTKLTSGSRVIPSLNIVFGLTADEAIDLSIKGRTVTFPGQAAVMTLLSFDKSVAGNYTVTVYNDGRRRHSSTTFSVTPSGPPEMPTNFQEVGTTTTSITVQWTKGFNGGHTQTFVILYRLEGGTRTETLSVKEQQQSTYTTEITGLKPNTRYQFNMYAFNEEGNSSLSSVVDIVVKTIQECTCAYKEEMTSNPNLASITLFIMSSLVLATTVSLIVCFIYRQKIRKMTGKDKTPQANSGVNLPQSPVGQHDITTERSHYDDLNLEEREPPSNYEYLGSNAAADAIAHVSTDDRQMYESLGTRTNASVYEDLKGPASRTYENTVIR